MTISYSAVGAAASHADTITPALPAGAAAGQLAVLVVVSGHTDGSTPSTPSGWTNAGSLSGGGGTFGAGTGPRRVTFFVRELVGGDAAPTTAIPSGSAGSHIAGRIISLSRSAGTGWRWGAAAGEDTSSGTGFSAVSSTSLTWAAGDVAVLGYGLASSSASVSAEAIAATGITYGTVTERVDDSIATGHTARLAVATGSVSSGSGTQAATVSATLAAASIGVGGVLRVREASAALAVSAQTVFPPRNLLSLTGMLAEDITTVSLSRRVSGALTAVRASTDVDVTGQNALVRVDAEQPFGVAVDYQAVLTDINGVQWSVTSAQITSTVSSDVISDAVRGIGAAVIIQSWPSKKRDRGASVYTVGGRIVVVSRPRSGAQATITVRTMTTADGDALQSVLDSLTEGVLLIRKQTTMEGVDNHLAVVADTEDRRWFDEMRYWQLEAYETEPWPDALEAAGFTLQDIADNFTSLQDLADAFTPGTLLDIATFDFGA
ncbi:hypothetical protein QA802_30615 [Streptomyces sp. B21-105]|uniref:hypothetical protein n=1 Tax=Streptomyces sp. B21-105 TaxID=3039417 RepID=UPI002FEEF416